MKFLDVELLEFSDGLLEQHRAELIAKTILVDKKLSKRIDVFNASNLPYKEAFAAEKIPDMPEALTSNVGMLLSADMQPNIQPNTSSNSRSIKNAGREFQILKLVKNRYANGVGIAASFALCFYFGFVTANWGVYKSGDELSLSLTSKDQAAWVERVAGYQTLYVENTVSGISPNMAATSALLEKIEQVSQIKTAVPDLTEHGYTFVRAQELGYQSAPLVQLVYFKPGSVPLAFCYMPSDGDVSAGLSISETEGLRTADWIHDGQRFVIVGNESAAVMQRLYESARTGWEI